MDIAEIIRQSRQSFVCFDRKTAQEIADRITAQGYRAEIVAGNGVYTVFSC